MIKIYAKQIQGDFIIFWLYFSCNKDARLRIQINFYFIYFLFTKLINTLVY